MSQVNFSSARVRLQDVRRGFEHTQWMILVPRLCNPLAQVFVKFAQLAGQVPMNAKYGIEHDPPKWDYVNPQQEAQADALQVATGLSSLSAKLRARGENPDKVFAEIAADFKKLKDSRCSTSCSSCRRARCASPTPAATILPPPGRQAVSAAAFAVDRSLLVGAGQVVRTDYVDVFKCRLACRDRMAVGDVAGAYQKLLQVGDASVWPCPNGHWEGDTFVIHDGRHEYVAALMLGRTHLFVAWLSEQDAAPK
jgi:hypothetical protein